jgi:integrase
MAEDFMTQHGRRPAWAELLYRQDKPRIVQDSMGHRSIKTTQIYNKSAFWRLLLSVAADPEHNPAIKGYEV